MHTSTITSKGQTTIPMAVQELLKVKPGDKLQYFVEEDGKVFILPKSLSIKDLRGILPKPKKRVTLNEMDEVVRSKVVERVENAK